MFGITYFYWFILFKKNKFNINTIVHKKVKLLKVIYIYIYIYIKADNKNKRDFKLVQTQVTAHSHHLISTTKQRIYNKLFHFMGQFDCW